MSDYQDLCEMNGRNPSDPDFIDDLIDEFSQEHEDYEEEYAWYKRAASGSELDLESGLWGRTKLSSCNNGTIVPTI